MRRRDDYDILQMGKENQGGGGASLTPGHTARSVAEQIFELKPKPSFVLLCLIILGQTLYKVGYCLHIDYLRIKISNTLSQSWAQAEKNDVCNKQ